jgi:hypothetical protein
VTEYILQCPNCGGKMSPYSKHCASCSSSRLGRSQSICPKCGGKKTARSKTCRGCRYPNGATPIYEYKKAPTTSTPQFNPDDIDPDWAMSFAGLFCGEGTILLNRYYGGAPIPVVQIHMRADELPLIQDIYNHLGGRIHEVKTTKTGKDGYRSKPQVSWYSSGHGRVEPILRLLLRTPIKARKLREAEFVLEYIAWRKNFGPRLTTEQKEAAAQYKITLSDMKLFKVQG